MNWIAHRREDGFEQPLSEHLTETARLASCFAKGFSGDKDALLAGTLHDIGKYSQHFQKRIRDPLNVPAHDHATAGAKVVGMSATTIPVAFSVAGHHGGIPDGGCLADTAEESTLLGRLQKEVDDYSAWQEEISLPLADPPSFFRKGDAFTCAFYTRMLFSCLVDADYLDTEAFMQGARAPLGYQIIATLHKKLNEYFNEWKPKDTQLNRIRSQIREDCEMAAKKETGLFTLTVPTGGGKTLSSLQFALTHAVKHKMERIIYVIPYTSIIDQTADVFSRVLGEEQVLAHHSSACYDAEAIDEKQYRKLLASENWDAPIIVTTAVQFFESLFSNRSSQCRKLHNITNSVLVFDEAQTLPIPYLRPCVAAIAQLIKHYRCTAVLCTATQPELEPLFLQEGIPSCEIAGEPKKLYVALRRTTIQDAGKKDWEEIGSEIAAAKSVLCVVNRRKRAQLLFEELPKEGSYCLSTLLYPTHRKRILSEIRQRLSKGLPCRVVSTSLIEAGVDLDFPLVYREEAGLDSLLQAGGRCNREGRADAEKSYVYLFRAEDKTLPMISQNVDALREIVRKYPQFDSPSAVRDYFTFRRSLCGVEAQDRDGILRAFEKGIGGKMFPFREVSTRFRLIDSAAQTVYIPLEEGEELIQKLQKGETSRFLYRKLAQFSVSVYPSHMHALYNAGAVHMLDGENAVLLDISLYHENTGLALDVESGAGIFI